MTIVLSLSSNVRHKSIFSFAELLIHMLFPTPKIKDNTIFFVFYNRWPSILICVEKNKVLLVAKVLARVCFSIALKVKEQTFNIFSYEGNVFFWVILWIIRVMNYTIYFLCWHYCGIAFNDIIHSALSPTALTREMLSL